MGQQLNVVDCFSGTGGLSYGLRKAGWSIRGSVENNPDCIATYEANVVDHKNLPHYRLGDIRNVAGRSRFLEDLKGQEIHLVAGGVPCQSFSSSGKRDPDDPRDSLYMEMLEIAKAVRPQVVLIENVKGIVNKRSNHSKIKDVVSEQICKDYAEIGYRMDYQILDASDYGVPQVRKRCIFIGNRIGVINRFPEPTTPRSEDKMTVRQAIERFVTMPHNPSINHLITKHKPEDVAKISRVPQGGSRFPNYVQGGYRPYWEGLSRTVKKNGGTSLTHPILHRCATPRELAALQSFPDDFIFYGNKTSQLMQICNAVPPLLGEALGKSIMEMLS